MTGIDPLLIFVGFVYVEFIDFKLELNLTKGSERIFGVCDRDNGEMEVFLCLFRCSIGKGL